MRRRHYIRTIRSPYLFRPLFRWLFWRQLRRNREYYRSRYYYPYY